MQALFYKGEDITLTFSSETSLAGYTTKTVKFFTPMNAAKTATVAPINDNSFSAKLAKADTAGLTAGRLNIVVELSNATNTIISKTIQCRLADAYLDGNAREAVDVTFDILFSAANQMTVNFVDTTPIVAEAIIRNLRDKLLIYSNPTGLIAINHDAAAPMPAADTKYILTTSGDCTWISAGTMNVIKGDEVACLVDAGVRTYVFLPNPSRSKDFYGVEWNMGAASPVLTRIGNMEWHRTLPVHSMMRRCILNDAGEVVYYLHATDSTKKEDGTTAVLDGTDGQVMVEIPSFYVALEHVGNVVRIKMSLVPFPNSIEIQKMYISAYEAALQRSTSKLSSVVNLTTDYRGGNNTSAWDAASNTLLGKPATNISLTNFRAYARNRGAKWNCNTYMWQKIMWWLLRVEYANLNDQLAYNSALTAEGYRQGGLGNGVTDIDSTKWNTFNGYNTFIPCGHTNLLGNATGVVAYAMPSEYDATIKTTYVPTYRGVENPFGHIWKWTDGVKVKIQSDADGGLSELYVCLNPANYQNTDYSNYIKRGLLPRTNGYAGKAVFGVFGEMLPADVVGSSTTYMCDYFYTSIPASGTEQRGLLFGGAAHNGAGAGCACAYSNNSPAVAGTNFGSRLCFLNI